MHRKDFIKQTCVSCAGFILLPSLLVSCGSRYLIQADMDDSGLIVPLESFDHTSGTLPYLIVENEKLEHPVVLFNGEQSHRAYLLKCTHQGVELQVFGDQITCPAHGSSFDHQGTVTNGPATEPLRQFPIELFDTYLKILLQ